MKRFLVWMAAALLACSVGSAVAADVLIGPGDVLKLSVYNNPDLATESRVSEAGTVTFPLLGTVAVAGLSVPDAEKKVAGLFEHGGYLRNPQVNIFVTVQQSQLASVLGQVNRPGRYPIEGKRSVLDLLAMAGGIAPEGGDTVNLIHKRDGKTVKDVVDIHDMVSSGDLNKDLDVASNDVIFVDRAQRFYIYGEVQHPGPIRLERNMTVLQALSAGGGLTPRGTERGIRIKRRDAKGELQTIDVKHDDLVLNGDVVYVKESWF